MPGRRLEQRTWVVVLAGGEGTRLAPLTRALYGEELPKQFATLRGAESMLQATVRRALALAPPTQIVVVIAAAREALAARQLAGWPELTLLAQPANLDTGPGVLFALAWLRARDPAARVVFMPADHDIPEPAPLVSAIQGAARDRGTRGRVCLVGVAPDRPETEYGWIVPGGAVDRRGGAVAVTKFVEKPTAHRAAALRGAGALWNTFIMAAPVAAMWRLGRRCLPAHANGLARWARSSDADAAARLGALYARLPPANWSRDVLARAGRDELAVLGVTGTGWSDWGTPRRVFASLSGTPAHAELVSRLDGADPAPPRPAVA